VASFLDDRLLAFCKLDGERQKIAGMKRVHGWVIGFPVAFVNSNL